ncbi:MAG: kelch repeat-containing protein [Gemmatimonadetes bacterium]|nr:kelch repeat-containing protein [Gemmatimonadota bacterium]
MTPERFLLSRSRSWVVAGAIAAALAVGCAPRAPLPAASSGSGRWELLPAGEQPTLRHENGYVRVGDRFYLVGGRGSKPVEIFDPATGRWSTGATPPVEMHHFQAVEYDGKIYVLGAMTGGWPAEPPLPNVYIYDPAADRWSQGPTIPADRRRGGAGAVVHEGQIYLVAGIQNGHTDGHVAWLDAFDPRTGAWRRLADAPRARDHFHAGVIDGKIYAAGGRLSSARPGEGFTHTVPEVDVYDLRSGSWSTLPATANLPTPRAGSTTAVLDGHLLVLGGESGTQEPAHAEVEALDPRTGRWTPLAPMAQGRHGTQAVVHEGRLYVAAGSKTRGADEINSQEVFTPRR